jgi:hypothetical protein
LVQIGGLVLRLGQTIFSELDGIPKCVPSFCSIRYPKVETVAQLMIAWG